MKPAAIDRLVQQTIGDGFAWAVRRLTAAGIDNAQLDARVLLEAAMGRSGGAILAWREMPMNDDQWQRFSTDILRRESHEPVARILGEKEFWGLPFLVDEHTLVPRPDSEVLIEAALAAFPERDATARVLDFGTGSGCLLRAVLAERPQFTGVGVDIAAGAAAVARRNAERLGLAGRAGFAVADWGAPLLGRFELILSNPPYIPDGDIATLEPEVADFDPRRALAGGAQGLDALTQMAASAIGLLAAEGTLIVEIGASQAASAGRCLARAGLAVTGIRHDLGGKERCLIARLL